MFFISFKKPFCSRGIQIFCNFYPSFSHFPDSTGLNGSGIIYDVINWLA